MVDPPVDPSSIGLSAEDIDLMNKVVETDYFGTWKKNIFYQ